MPRCSQGEIDKKNRGMAQFRSREGEKGGGCQGALAQALSAKAAVRAALSELAAPADEAEIAKQFTRASKNRIVELLETLSLLGKARQRDDGRYVPVIGTRAGDLAL